MQTVERKRFIACLTAASEMYGKPLSDAVIGLWWQTLAGYEFGGVERAFQAHLADPDRGQFMPRPADIVRLIAGTSRDNSLLAWAKVDKGIREIGTYATVTFDDPIINRVVEEMGGWIRLGTKTEDEWPFVGNEFRNRYQGYRSRGEVPEYPAKLIGLAEAQNAQNGFPADDVVLIGDRDAARKVLAGGGNAPAIGFTRASHALALAALSTETEH